LANAGNGNTTSEQDEAALAGMSASEKKKAKQAMRKVCAMMLLHCFLLLG
jgi:hypothetical protein